MNVPSVFTVAIGTTSHIMENAAIRLLGLNSNQIAHQAADIIFGQLRQVIASLPIEQINRDRDTFLHRIQESIEPELNKIGLVLINVNITDITDGSGYIEALGKKAASEAIQQATIAVAEEEKRGAIGVASAIREKEIAVADANKLREIGTQEAEREKAVRVAEILKERSVAEEQARFEKEARVKEAEQSMRVTIANADALAVQGENTAKAEIVASEAQLKVKQAEAYLLAEAREREAAAEVAAREALARAKAAEAEAAKVEAQKRAELEAPARAKKATTIVEAEAEAERERILAEGRARAALIEAEAAAKASYIDLEAQARGEYETLAKKAEGLREIVQSCGGVQGAFQLLMLEHIDKLAETAASAIANIRFDKVTVWDSGNGEKGGGGAAGFLRSLGQAVPPLHDVIRNLGGVELPSFFGR
ncbi:MAG TPA: SPFH domain-containing protein, partial [Planctomycetota bacterium]|nr:SPFH domain-containing protein [Planctomycetota bacterium]